MQGQREKWVAGEAAEVVGILLSARRKGSTRSSSIHFSILGLKYALPDVVHILRTPSDTRKEI